MYVLSFSHKSQKIFRLIAFTNMAGIDHGFIQKQDNLANRWILGEFSYHKNEITTCDRKKVWSLILSMAFKSFTLFLP